jgi:hypothetical protein
MVNVEEFALEQHRRYIKVDLSAQITKKDGICKWSYLKLANGIANNVNITKNVANLAEKYVLLQYNIKEELKGENNSGKILNYKNELLQIIQELILQLKFVQPSDSDDIFNLENDKCIAKEMYQEACRNYWSIYTV